jgi:phage-related protein
LGRFEVIVNYIRDFVEPIFNAVRGAFVKIGDAIRDQEPRFQSIIDTFADIFKWLNQYIIPILKTQFVAAIESFASAASVAIKVVVPVIETVLNTIKSVINGIISVINTAINLYNKANNLFGGKDIANIGKIGAGGTTTSGTVGGVQLPFGGANVGGATGATGNALGSGIGAGLGSALGTALGSAVGNSAAKAVKELPKTLIEEISEANWLKKTIEEGVFDAARFRMGEERSMLPPVPSMPTFDVAAARRGEERGNTYNVTVNGAMDSESTARQIVTLLNDSQARGTLGASGFAGLIAE